jgi:ubiquinol-cytochrome c reductase cytochrome c subunit
VGPDRRALGGWIALVGAVAVGLVASGALGGLGATALGADPSSPAAPAAGVVDAGRSLFQNQCATCHGMQGQGTANGPALTASGAAAADFYLRTGRMPLSAPGQPVVRHDPRLTEDEIRALTAFVAGLGHGPEIPQVAGGGDVGAGNRLFVANCAACHGATGSGNAIGGGTNAADLSRATAVQIVEAIRIGPGQMPRFDLSPDEEAAVVAYVESLRTAPSPGGLDIGGFGAVAEGFVAVAIGLVLLVGAAMFVGRRSHEGEPGPTGPPTATEETSE